VYLALFLFPFVLALGFFGVVMGYMGVFLDWVSEWGDLLYTILSLIEYRKLIVFTSSTSFSLIANCEGL
jgi:hypothetical protein